MKRPASGEGDGTSDASSQEGKAERHAANTSPRRPSPVLVCRLLLTTHYSLTVLTSHPPDTYSSYILPAYWCCIRA